MKLLLSTMLAALFASSAFGSLILQSTTPTFDVTGTGLGAVNTVLTIQSPNSTDVETGCVAPLGSGVTTSGCGQPDSTVLTGASQIGTPTLSTLGITSGTDIGLVLNASEPAGNSIYIGEVVLTLYGSGGITQSFVCSNCGVTANSTQTGTGSSGFLFTLDGAQASNATAFITSNGAANVKVGVAASLGSATAPATGGHETFYVANIGGMSGVPEPATIGLIGVGLLAVGALRKYRRTA